MSAAKKKAPARERSIDPATITEARARLFEAARAVDAEGFAAFAVSATAERQLNLRLDSGNPSAAQFLSAFPPHLASEGARHAQASGAAFWWSAGSLDGREIIASHWALRSAWSGLPQPGVGLPCATDSGQCGLVLFWGAGLHVGSGRELAKLHALASAVFLSVAAGRQKSEKLPHISKRELECLKLTAKGLTSDEIAVQLALSVHTTNQYLGSASEKLDAVNRIHAVAKALRSGMID